MSEQHQKFESAFEYMETENERLLRHVRGLIRERYDLKDDLAGYQNARVAVAHLEQEAQGWQDTCALIAEENAELRARIEGLRWAEKDANESLSALGSFHEGYVSFYRIAILAIAIIGTLVGFLTGLHAH